MKNGSVTQTSSRDENGLVRWLRRVFGSKPSPPPLPRRSSKAAAGDPAHEAEAVDEWAEYLPGLAPHVRAVGLAFQLPAPLSAAQLEQVEQLAAAVVELAARDDTAPNSLPSACLRMLNLAARSDVEVSELASAIHQDPALTAAVLRVANSAGQGSANGAIHTVRDAVLRMGVTESARVAGAVAAKALFSPRSKSTHALFAAQFADLNVAAASAAGGSAYLAMDRGVGRSDLAYLGGMLHDVGKSLALSALASLAITDSAARELEPEVLGELLELVHVELGTLAHERWALPAYLTELCAASHDAHVPESPTHTELHLVRVVSGLLALRTRPQPLERLAELEQSIVALRITPLQTRALDTELRSRNTQVRSVLGL
jgi:HD-like signal output (HDOD) protein